MPSFNADLVLFLISLLLLTASFLYTVALVIPSLGKMPLANSLLEPRCDAMLFRSCSVCGMIA